MELIKKVNLLENEVLAKKLGYLSLPLFFIFGAVFFWIASQIRPDFSADFWELLLVAVLYLVVLVIHELIHGLFFKLFNPDGQVKFGFKNGMAYAASPHSVYSKGKFAWISLAPFLIITILLVGLLLFDVLSPLCFVGVATLHAGSCIGDFYWIVLIIQAPQYAVIEDTEQGINFYLPSR